MSEPDAPCPGGRERSANSRSRALVIVCGGRRYRGATIVRRGDRDGDRAASWCDAGKHDPGIGTCAGRYLRRQRTLALERRAALRVDAVERLFLVDRRNGTAGAGRKMAQAVRAFEPLFVSGDVGKSHGRWPPPGLLPRRLCRWPRCQRSQREGTSDQTGTNRALSKEIGRILRARQSFRTKADR